MSDFWYGWMGKSSQNLLIEVDSVKLQIGKLNQTLLNCITSRFHKNEPDEYRSHSVMIFARSS